MNDGPIARTHQFPLATDAIRLNFNLSVASQAQSVEVTIEADTVLATMCWWRCAVICRPHLRAGHPR